MLISTSRKPSQKTRKFCKNFAHALSSNYINRGKMNMHQLLVKAIQLDETNVAVVNEIKGNPSRITFYNNQGEIYLIILISVTTTNQRLNIQRKNLKIVSKVKELDILSEILDLDLVERQDENVILISKDEKENFLAKINFINKFGEKSEFSINVKKILIE